MIQIRDVLQVKFGSIDQAVDLFTQLSTPESKNSMLGEQFGVLTDITGAMYTLVNEVVVDSLAQFTEMREKQFTQPEFDEWFKQFQLFVEGGRREYFTVEGQYENWSRPGVVVVRECYQAYKWQIHRAVSLLQRYGGFMETFGVGKNPRILTDLSGPMFQAVIEIETESMSAWESQRRTLFQEVEFQVWFNQMLTTVEAGSHEFYRVEFTSG
ncbi:MAG: hypothetical protein EHM41_22995 [Chloroflexi bacterium]|nr:MAG: hypothetical protein EHM41_22995 [Chloroflexota bacterium]